MPEVRKLKRPSCPSCGKSEFSNTGKIEEINIYQCDTCKALFNKNSEKFGCPHCTNISYFVMSTGNKAKNTQDIYQCRRLTCTGIFSSDLVKLFIERKAKTDKSASIQKPNQSHRSNRTDIYRTR